jgi:hypothetical protein
MRQQPTFIVIGAQKSATTSLYHWLRRHPQIYLSQQKELDFFSQPVLYERGLDYYCKTWFAGAGRARAIGEVSPQYMLSSAVPERIAALLPGVKLLALLRNPIDRALSHYAMQRMRGMEHGTFEQATRELLSSAPALIDHVHDNYLVAGLYGNILEGYARLFPSQSLQITFYEELLAEPRRELRRILEFIGVDPELVAHEFREQYNRRADGRRFPGFEAWVLRQQFLKRVIKSITPAALSSRFLFWFDTEFNVRRERETGQAAESGVGKSLRSDLREYFRADVGRLQALLNRGVPWPEFAPPTAVSGGR